ncbi:MAG: cation-translocating P-type ATPase [Firmicutes bacterium]|nr:cation-translocating P-type ATPase [Bacillota bacterium]
MAKDFDIKNVRGLSENAVAEKLKNEGYNELPSSKKRSFLNIVIDVVKEPMFLLLVACGLIYFLLGEKQEAMMLLGFVFVIIGITIYQERKTERALEALRDLTSPRALVIRDGEQKRIAGREVVTEDVIVLAEGDRVPADARLIWQTNMNADESLLTGESVPVRKTSTDKASEVTRPGGDDLPFVFSGTLVTSGQGVAVVVSTGVNTEIGKIGKALHQLEPEETPLQVETGKMVKKLAIFGASLCLAVILLYGFTRTTDPKAWLNGFLAGITLAMAMLPEEFPVVLTIFLALGAWRISQKNVLTRRVPAVETLGSATVLCVDKTGTLTQNKMTVAKLFADGEFYDVLKRNPEVPLPEKFHEIVEYSILASQKDPFDPMEKALRAVGDMKLANTEHLHDDWSLIREYPLSDHLLALSHVWKSPDGSDYEIAAKGAPEAIADLCHVSAQKMSEIREQITTLASDGLRVLGVAKAKFRKSQLPEEQHDFVFEFLGLVGFMDPVRSSVPDAIRECYDAGIRVIMITGDYPATACNIARQIGLKPADQFITGAELDSMTDEQLKSRISSVCIFARVVPEQKLRLVKALKEIGEVVAMTGDGVNDAPALKAAHIGIAMGGRGTDVAREASSLVLVDDDFSSIVSAVRMGRRIFDNIKKAMAYIFAIHVPIAGLSLVPVALNWPLILYPVHIVFLELIIDPACSVAFEAEPEEKGTMKRPPRNPSEPLFNAKTLFLSILQGVSVMLFVLGVNYVSRVVFHSDHTEQDARALTFTTLIVANLALIMTNRSWTETIFQSLKKPNKALWAVVAGTFLFLIVVLNTPFLLNLFKLGRLQPVDYLICTGVGFFSILWFEVLKYLKVTK